MYTLSWSTFDAFRKSRIFWFSLSRILSNSSKLVAGLRSCVRRPLAPVSCGTNAPCGQTTTHHDPHVSMASLPICLTDNPCAKPKLLKASYTTVESCIHLLVIILRATTAAGFAPGETDHRNNKSHHRCTADYDSKR